MGLAPVSRLTKAEINFLAANRCKHRHTYLEHYQCYIKENPTEIRTGVLDIECSNLKADFGIILCYSTLSLETGSLKSRIITRKEALSKDMDKKLVRELVKDMKGFTRVITYYGTGFDLPFIRTRALIHKIPFIPYGELNHKDIYYTVKSKLATHRKSLDVACQAVLGRSNKTHFLPVIWTRALQGDQKALAYVKEHCEYDVKDTADLYHAMEPFTVIRNTSI